MSDNIFHDALADANATAARMTSAVVSHPHFFQDLHRQQREQAAMAKMTRQEAFNKGLLTAEDLDDEELRLGRCRGADGKIPRVTKTLSMIPRDLHEEIIAEHHKRTHEKYRQQLDVALQTMAECMVDPSAEWRDRNDAAKYITERVMGKPQERVSVSVTKAPWEELLGDVAHITKAQHEQLKDGAIDAEFVEIPDNSQPDNLAPSGEAGQPANGWPSAGSPMGNLRPPGGAPYQETATSQRGDSTISIQATANDEGQSGTSNGQVQRGQMEQPTAAVDSGIVAGQTQGHVDVRPGDDSGLGDDGDRRAEQRFVDEDFGLHGDAGLPPQAPSHIAPASSSYVVEQTLSEQIVAAQAKAGEVAIARANRKALIENAKKRRKVMRVMGTDMIHKGVDAQAFARVQDKLVEHIDD